MGTLFQNIREPSIDRLTLESSVSNWYTDIVILGLPDLVSLALAAHPETETSLIHIDYACFFAYESYYFMAKNLSLTFKTWSLMKASEGYCMGFSRCNIMGLV